MNRKFHLNSAQIIPLGFLGLIIIGALLLWLPISTTSGEMPEFSTALFTSTTSVCVTGSVVVDTYSYWSGFGQAVILLLIQLGGLGIVSIVSLAIVNTKKRKSYAEILLLKDSFNLESMRGVAPFINRVFVGTLTVEALGAIGYMFAFIPRFGVLRGIYYSFFTSVSAFCNAGIDVMGPDSLVSFYNNELVLVVTMFLIIAGGIGYVVWFDLGFTHKRIWKRNKSIHGSNEHTRLVIRITLVLIALGAILTLILEWDNPETIGGMNVWDKITNSTFQSVTYRTAGFTTFSQAGMRESSTLVGDILMFIGGSPVGTAGGVKTVTIFVVVVNVMAFVRGRYEVVIFGRRIPDNLIRQAMAIVAVHLVMTIILTIALMIAEGTNLSDSLYEIMSGICTVGVSRGLTPNLHLAGRIILILAMYLGRIGPISMALFFNAGSNYKNSIHYAKGRFLVG
ncbi:MAG: potassium transporter TrkG [Eubacterium sp.]|nr:potassium transporter TrkG [Eubacterium sp.]